jgi:hypothetical protein
MLCFLILLLHLAPDSSGLESLRVEVKQNVEIWVYVNVITSNRLLEGEMVTQWIWIEDEHEYIILNFISVEQ